MEVRASLFKNWRCSLERVEKFLSPIYFHDINLHGRLYSDARHDAIAVRHAAGPQQSDAGSGEYLCPSQQQDRPSFADVVPALNFEAEDPVGVGFSFGPTWSTHWFRVQLNLPDDWLGKHVHFRWNSNCEALVYNADGHPLQGLSGGISHSERLFYPVSRALKSDEQRLILFVEAACNDLFGAGNGSMIAPPDPDRRYNVQQLDVAVFDDQIYELLIDLETLHDLAKHLGESNNRAHQALYTANHMINLIDWNQRETLSLAHALATKFFGQKNGETQHRIVAIANCHIDTAWLWPYAESIRKCARSWSSAVALMQQHPQMVFACSQAQQLYWVKEKYPSLFKSLQAWSGKGNFLPVGGTWVEMDGNIPSGESFIRQFLYGQRFFREEFKRTCTEFWLPDTFGYHAQIPQIMTLCGAKHFLSQKLSWSLVNKFPHSSFVWQGLDGTQVLAHFPPADTYTSSVRVDELLRAASNLRDKGRVAESVLLYGFGDGGGGPTEDMMQRQIRLADVDGCPRLISSTPEQFFERLERYERQNLNRWSGELFLEMHNGTYTTQAAMKTHNRRGELQLRDCEFLAAMHAVMSGHSPAPPIHQVRDRLDELWRPLLLNQFHDVLPGSSIGLVHREARALYQKVQVDAVKLLQELTGSVFGQSSTSGDAGEQLVAVNTLSWPRTEVLVLERWTRPELQPRKRLVQVTIPAFGFVVVPLDGEEDFQSPSPISPAPSDGHFVLENEHLRAIVDSVGRVVSLIRGQCGRETVATGQLANQLILYDDVPLYWDAWDTMDYHLETGKPQNHVTSGASVSDAGDEIVVEMKIGAASRLRLSISLPPGKPYVLFDVNVEWQENRKFLKVEFPVNVHSPEASYEIQFGHLRRPTHFNTSWDSAKYEVCGHKWMDLSEHDWGVALLNDCKYGHAVHGNVMRLSLLRSPKAPDLAADMGQHSFRYALMPHSGTLQEAGVIRQAYEFNVPVLQHFVASSSGLTATSKSGGHSLFSVDSDGVVLETVKPAAREDGCLLVRLYEAFGGRCHTTLQCRLNLTGAALCNGLEDELEQIKVIDDRAVRLSFTPFQIVSVLLRF